MPWVASDRSLQLWESGAKPISQLSPLGFLVTDASLRLLFTNREAIAIMTYPLQSPVSLDDAFQKKISLRLVRAQRSPVKQTQCSIKLKSGRRTYFCRVFRLQSNGIGSNGTGLLMVLERGKPGSLALSQVSEQFNLTHREQEAVALALQGLGNKEIAQHLDISPNTVKTYLNLAAIKMGVSSRSGIVTKVLGLILFSGSSESKYALRGDSRFPALSRNL